MLEANSLMIVSLLVGRIWNMEASKTLTFFGSQISQLKKIITGLKRSTKF